MAGFFVAWPFHFLPWIDFLPLLLRAEERPELFLPLLFLADEERPDDFCAAVFLPPADELDEEDFLPEDLDLPRPEELRPLPLDFLRGTFSPASLASDNPIAIACLRLVTFLPLRPLFNWPRFFFVHGFFNFVSCTF